MNELNRANIVSWLTISYILTIFFPVIALIMAYVKKNECQSDQVLYSHVQKQIKICWIFLVGGFISGILFIIFIGMFTLLALFIWVVYEVVKGYSNLQKNISA